MVVSVTTVRNSTLRLRQLNISPASTTVTGASETASPSTFCHTHGDTSHVRELMHDLEDTLHHLRNDINAMRRPVHHHNNHYYGKKVYPVPGGGGITVGNGNFKFHFGF